MRQVDAVQHQPKSVERLQSSLEALVRERQELRSSGADRDALERNRAAIVNHQRDLGAALIARYSPQPAA
jgi:hypothetical protein